MAVVYGGLLAVMGVLISWAAPACNNPIFAEIVPPHLRNMIYSFDRQALAKLWRKYIQVLQLYGFGRKLSSCVGLCGWPDRRISGHLLRFIHYCQHGGAES